jgi:hypothetical protein
MKQHRIEIMKSKIAIVVFLVAVAFYADGLFAEDGGLAEQYKKSLTSEAAQESQQLPEKPLRGSGGSRTESPPRHKCRGEYKSEVDSCKSIHDNPEQFGDLRMCIDKAKDEYDRCIKELER